MSYVVYSMEGCASCVSAVKLLESRKAVFEVKKIDEDPAAWQWLKDQGLRSMPQIFLDGVLIPGGFAGLAKQVA